MNEWVFKRAVIILFFLSGIFIPPSYLFAEKYNSEKLKFSIEYDENWKYVSTPEKIVDYTLFCISENCSKDTNIAFGGFYNPKLKNLKVDKFLMAASARAITTNIRPYVKKLKVIREGRVRLGRTKAYEVLMNYEALGRKRTRHTFMTFNKGYVYNISVHSSPVYYERDIKLAMEMIRTFRFN